MPTYFKHISHDAFMLERTRPKISVLGKITVRARIIEAAAICALTCSSFLAASSIASAAEYGTPEVRHALYLQTTGMTAEMAVVEPCTTEGMADAVKRGDAAYENQDIVTLSAEQGGFAVGFAKCALNATVAQNFANFAAATVQSEVAAIDAEIAMSGSVTPSARAHGRAMYVVAKWLLHCPYASSVAKSIAHDEIAKMKKIHAI